MRQILSKLWRDKLLLELTIAPLTFSVFFTLSFYQLGMTLGLTDAISRLMMSRRVTDSLTPDILQLGGIWPPAPQALSVLPAAYDPLYRSGLAGVFFPMVCFILGSVAAYKIVKGITGDRQAGLVGARVIYLCPNILYLQSTPMSDVPYLGLSLTAIWMLLQWEKQFRLGVKEPQELKPLILTALLLMFAAMTRYEGFLLAGVASIFVFTTYLQQMLPKALNGFHNWGSPLAVWRVVSTPFGEAFGTGTYIWSFVGPWLVLLFLSALVIYNNVFYFLQGDYSTKAINLAALKTAGSISQHAGSWLLSTHVYFRTLADNVGWVVMVISGLGLGWYLFERFSVVDKAKVCLILLFPVVFSVTTMVYGNITVIYHPDFANGAYWNVRYPLLMVPTVSVLVGILVKNNRLLQWGVTVLLLGSLMWTLQTGIINLQEAQANKEGVASIAQHQAATFLKANYDQGLVLMQNQGEERLQFYSGLPLKRIVYEGNAPYWDEVLKDPTDQIRWIVATVRSPNDRIDKVWESLKGNPALEDNYTLVYSGQAGIRIYKRNF